MRAEHQSRGRGGEGLPESADGALKDAVCRNTRADAQMLKYGNHASSSRRYVLLYSFAFFADDVTNAIARVPEQLHAVANAYEGDHG